ncbi:MAG: SRPBCC family protein [Myxococcota bacterium]
MKELRVQARYAAPPADVFEAVSDHEVLLTTPATRCRLLQEGEAERNGLGALREIRSAGLVFREEIVAFTRPHRYEYVIRSLKGPGGLALPVEHELGWLELTPEGEGTRVDWVSRFCVKLPGIGGALEGVLGPRFEATFAGMLEGARKRLS